MSELIFNPPPDFIPSPHKPADQITDADVLAVFPNAELNRAFCAEFRRQIYREYRQASLTHLSIPSDDTQPTTELQRADHAATNG